MQSTGRIDRRVLFTDAVPARWLPRALTGRISNRHRLVWEGLRQPMVGAPKMEKKMKKAYCLVAFMSLAVTCLAAPSITHAESGTAELLFSGVSTLSSVQMGDTTVTSSATSGTITTIRSSGGPFAEGVSGTVQCARFSRKSPSGFELEADCVGTFATGATLSFLFKRKSGDVVAGSKGEGTLQIAGIAGAFAGVTGECKYRVENFPGNWNVTLSNCQWSR
jgi:hypothetical protein